MARPHFALFLCLLLLLPGPALAEREIHIVAIGKGHQTNDFYALPEARVLVDRPGQEVGLVLVDGGTVHWKIEPTPGTFVSEIIRSGAEEGESAVSLSGIPLAGVDVPGLPLVFRPFGRDFRALIESASGHLGVERFSGFYGRYKASDAPIVITRVDIRTPGLQQDYLADLVEGDEVLPAGLRLWLAEGGPAHDYALVFDVAGVTLTGPDGTREFPVTPNVPDVFLPVTAVYDAGSGTIYCLSYGAEGYIYSVDVETGEWSVVSALDGYDAATLLFDANSQRLIMTGAFSRPGQIKVYGLDGSRSSTFIRTTDVPGLTDLFDYGNEYGPPLTPLVYQDGWLLLEARAAGAAEPGSDRAFRLYAIEIETGMVRLLDYAPR